ncbi:MAG: hypothetical protein HYY26_01495 [Acidobacteria bacterium]|nr:hypothetical protein [Acidobacteriota bacterium]
MAACLLLTAVPLSPAQEPPSVPDRVLGRLVTPDSGRVLVREEEWRCEPLEGGAADVRLLVLGTESEQDGAVHFHPVAALAFDTTLAGEEPGQWMVLWVFGPSPAGWRRNLQAFLPFPAGAPTTSEARVKKLEAYLAGLRERPEETPRAGPEPVVHLAELDKSRRSQGVLGGLRRGLAWAGVAGPAQFLFRSYLLRHKDRRERDFQRAYLAVQWLADLQFHEGLDPRWVTLLNDLRFYLLRNRSFFGRFLSHADAADLVYGYESDSRRQLGKSSSWLQSAANEHYLRYQPIYRYTENGAGFPIGGVLYYDPQLRAEPDPGWWSVANPFDLPYNPHTHAEVQRLANAYPDELIPLALYSFRTNLTMRPTIVVDFFAPSNPRKRESTHQLMLLAKQWLAITTGPLSLERIPYQALAWSANKKGFTYLVDKSARLGVEEMRLALESGLYFEPEVREELLERVDQRVLNPLVKASREQEVLAHIQYESLRARGAEAVCQRVKEVRAKLQERLKVPEKLTASEARRELARRLEAWHYQVRLEDFVAQPLDDFGSLGLLTEPLGYFLRAEPADAARLEEVLAELYAKLFRQQLLLPEGRRVAELDSALELARQVWERVYAAEGGRDFERRRARVEREEEKWLARLEQKIRERQVKELRGFLEQSHKQFTGALKTGCGAGTPLPSELEAHLWLLLEVQQAALGEERLRREFERQRPRLERDLQALETQLARCPEDGTETWQAQTRRSCLELARALREQLAPRAGKRVEGGG